MRRDQTEVSPLSRGGNPLSVLLPDSLRFFRPPLPAAPSPFLTVGLPPTTGRNGFTQLTVAEKRTREVGVCSPGGTLGVAANPTLWQSAPPGHFGYGVVVVTTSLLRRFRLTGCTTLHICSTCWIFPGPPLP
ncbi:MAG: hypothetical protein EHM12_13665 [Dehalococcoidia bacterium]|nr:MAG: hypothetical protein EHM12_13665 [Dehalococcoidia bacterium]